jgi:hypothetical protein
MPIERRKHITRQMLRDEPNTLFVFGDNLAEYGLGGQAKEMRGEPNAVGIPTKRAPTMKANAFFDNSDACLAAVKPTILARFSLLDYHLSKGGTVVFPEAGIGSGLADLATKSPKIWNLIQTEISHLENIKGEQPCKPPSLPSSSPA